MHNVRQYLPYLYLVFFSSLPFLLYKNYLYYRYHSGPWLVHGFLQ